MLLALAAGTAAVGGLTGCTDDDDPNSPGAQAPPDPDLALVAAVSADKDALITAYAATANRFPGAAGRLRPLREDHEAHADALLRFGSTGPSPDPSATPSAGPVVPADRTRALAALADLETAAAGRRIGQCENARNPDLARLIAALGGCEAAHAAALKGGAVS